MDKLDLIISESIDRYIIAEKKHKDLGRSRQLRSKATATAKDNAKKAAEKRSKEFKQEYGNRNGGTGSRAKAKDVANDETTNLTAVARKMRANGLGTQYTTANSLASYLRKQVKGEKGASGGHFKLYQDYADGILKANK